MSKETDLLEGMLELAKRHGYEVKDLVIDPPRVEFGLLKMFEADDVQLKLKEE